ncbi:hypothetical protein L1987_02172 [Smallanthus sonchifolius]|uniref:Uncharacterized protein n=1 Tax=Smallanthus sonchifolius TaxID=185202 RepID=A0ACB9K704_9ASTR|nr:hypothetical protein L1987_02172 [Smallanthus sonchifolius]
MTCSLARDQPLDDWNVRPPPLSLWSRPDWTANHIQVAEKHNHRHQKQPDSTPPNCENTNTTSHTLDDVIDMELSSPGLYANTSVPYGPYGYGPGVGYTQSGHYANYGYPGCTFYYGQPNYGYPAYPPNSTVNPQGPTHTVYSQEDFTSEGTTSPYYRFN